MSGEIESSKDEIKDEGGYWLGTEKSQNAALLMESRRRPSVVKMLETHGDEIRALEERFPNVAVHDLVRFLKARNYNVQKAGDMYQAHFEWRDKTLPIPEEAVRDTLNTKKFYLLDDPDAGGRPVFVYCLRRFKEMGYVVEDEIQALVYVVENDVIPRFGPSFDTKKFTVLFDVSGVRSPPMQFLQQVNKVMEANYPEMLFRSVMFPVPSWLQKIIQGLLIFVAKETREKFAYVNDVKSLEEFAMMPLDKMGPDVAELTERNELKE